MDNKQLLEKCNAYLNALMVDISERCVGSEGNRSATRFFSTELKSLGWQTLTQEFDAIDWKDGGATLQVGQEEFTVFVSPYAPGCQVKGTLEAVENIAGLEKGSFQDKIIFLHGEIAMEQLMPKNFVFYNPEHHQKIVSLLESSGASAIICATGRNAALAGGVYPFPLIEDGDFTLPSIFMTEEEGSRLLNFNGQEAMLSSKSERIAGKGFNVTGFKGPDAGQRIVITAHIDAKKGSPGAIDNATGVVVLLLLAHLLKDYAGQQQIELVAFNGEDYFSVPGQMAWIAANHDQFDNIALNINIDGAGYLEGDTAFSFFDLPSKMHQQAKEVVENTPGLVEGAQWVQGDHSIFTQFGRPAIAITSQWFLENLESQDITHTSKDNGSIVDSSKLVAIATAVKEFILWEKTEAKNIS